jgi:anti-anti-sigma regulatory factor
MPTHITQLDDPEHGKIILRIDGDMLFDDAVLLEKIVHELGSAAESLITIDLADLDFLDSEAAPVLRRIADQANVDISGMEIFLQTSVNVAERSNG